MTKRKHFRVLVLPALISLTACSSVSSMYSAGNQEQDSEGVQLSLSTSHWQVESINQAGIIDFSHVTLNVNSSGDVSRVSGTTGCNQYTGELNAKNTDKTFSEDSEAQPFSADKVILTRKMCAKALMKQEQRFVDALTSSKTYAIIDNTWLVLYDSRSNEKVKAVITAPSQGATNRSAKLNNTKVRTAQQVTTKKQDVSSTNVVANVIAYECETPNASTRELRVNTLGPDTLALSLNNTHHIVQLSRSASGAKYTNNKGVAFWNKGDVATVSINSGYYHCTIKTERQAP